MRRRVRTRTWGKKFALASAVGGLVAAPLALAAPAQAAPSADDVTINLLNINDFHGRIDDNTVGFAATIQKLRHGDGADGANTLLLSAGDNYGASLFASAIQKNKPTLDVLNALNLDASAVGNHEFDQGFSDLKNRVIGNLADFPYLGANVYYRKNPDASAKNSKASCFQTKPLLKQYATFDVNGVTVGVIGAVTQSTPDKVSPGGIKHVQFCDPVDAVNRVAKQLTDGRSGNGEADVLVAEYHSGAPVGADESTLKEQLQTSQTFRKIVKGTNPKVDVLMTGDSHEKYAWKAKIPGTDRTRPVLETGSYGENVGQVTLSVDPSNGAVTHYTVQNVPSLESGKIGKLANDPVVQEVKKIVQQALAYAEKVGNKPVGKITANITTAYTDTNDDGKLTRADSRDDRSEESTLGDLVANMLLYTFRPENDKVTHHADIGIINPGGLRAELFYQGDTSTNPKNTDGVVTYAEANEVLPFNDNLWTVDLKGSQLKTILEQQWQPPDADDPYLQLGLSSNVTYTFNPDAAKGHHITSVMINGQPLDPDKTYTVATESFLGEGGDHFYEFADGVHHDSGLVDREGWIAFLKAHRNPGLSPDFARQSVAAKGLPDTVRAGTSMSFSLSKLDLTSLGSPDNTKVTVSLVNDGTTVGLGTFPVTDGAATIKATVPANTAAGDYVLTVVAAPTETTVQVPVTVTAAASTPPPTTAPTSTQSLPTKVPAGVSGSGGSGGGADAGVVGGLAGGALVLVVAAAAAVRRRGSHQV